MQRAAGCCAWLSHLSGEAVEHEVGRVPVSEAEDVADHAHHRQRPGVARAPLEPRLAVVRLEPEHLC